MLTQKRLKQLLHYDPDTGLFTWLARSSKASRVKIGSVIKTTHSKKDPYIICNIDMVSYKGHRVAFLYMTGKWPRVEVDHRNLDKSDNRWENLRESNDVTNGYNRALYANNTSGHKGISWNIASKKWHAYINHNRKRYTLGRFDSLDDAVEVVRQKRIELHGEFLNHG